MVRFRCAIVGKNFLNPPRRANYDCEMHGPIIDGSPCMEEATEHGGGHREGDNISYTQNTTPHRRPHAMEASRVSRTSSSIQKLLS
jgi:hypothetical protein